MKKSWNETLDEVRALYDEAFCAVQKALGLAMAAEEKLRPALIPRLGPEEDLSEHLLYQIAEDVVSDIESILADMERDAIIFEEEMDAG